MNDNIFIELRDILLKKIMRILNGVLYKQFYVLLSKSKYIKID